jgi:hypothetical protein
MTIALQKYIVYSFIKLTGAVDHYDLVCTPQPGVAGWDINAVEHRDDNQAKTIRAEKQRLESIGWLYQASYEAHLDPTLYGRLPDGTATNSANQGDVQVSNDGSGSGLPVVDPQVS